jgi:hypothetical protein
MSISQTEFNQFVRTFNDNYLELLRRAAQGTFDDRLVQSFVWLRDTYEVILRLHDVGEVNYEAELYPLSLRGNEELLVDWGFKPIEIDHIFGFLDYFRSHNGRDLEAFAATGGTGRLAKKPS